MVLNGYLSLLLTLLSLVVGICLGRPKPADDHVTMSGEPTHFQVDDKAAELEINANAMGVKVNAKPASLQVVSKPGSPSIPVAHPAVVVPQLPAPYMPAPFYPGPSTILPPPPPLIHKHHFFMDSAIGNYNSKKTKVPEKNSKKSKIPKDDGKTKKRQWIQRLPLFSPVIPLYPQITNIKVHPLVQEMIAEAQSRQNIPSMDETTPQRYSIGNQYQQRLPIMNGDPRNMIQRSVFISPSTSPYTLANTGSFIRATGPTNQQLYYNPTGMPAVFSRGYYDPMISRDFIPAFNSPMIPTPKTFIPQAFIGGGGLYQGMIPLGAGQRFSKRLTIPRTPGTNKTPVKRTEKEVIKPSHEKRSTEIQEKIPKKKNTVSKRQFILTQPTLPQRTVAYVPVVLNPATQPNVGNIVPNRRNMVLNFPSSIPSQFILRMPSTPQQLPNMALYQPQSNVNTMGLQRSLVETRGPGIAALQMPAAARSLVQPSPSASLADLAGMQGEMSYQRSPHMTLYTSDPLLSQFQDQIFGDSTLEGRTQIPRQHGESENLVSPSSSSSSDDEEAYIDEDGPSRLLDHVTDQGSYTQQTMPDGRTVFRKDHVGFGPITVEANTVESKDHSDATDMDLDSDKRKLIPRPHSPNNLDRRLKIPKPDS